MKAWCMNGWMDGYECMNIRMYIHLFRYTHVFAWIFIEDHHYFSNLPSLMKCWNGGGGFIEDSFGQAGCFGVLVPGVSGKIGRELAICCTQRSNMGLYRDLYWIDWWHSLSSFLWLINIDGMSQVRHDGTCPASFQSFFWTGDAEYFACGSPYSLEKVNTSGDPPLRFPTTRIRASPVVDPYLCTDSPSQQAKSMGPFPVTEGCGNHAAA